MKLIHRPLSDEDLRKLLGSDLRILKYSELAEVRDLNELLTRPQDYCIILYEEVLDTGHWTGLLKYNGVFEHFDSYGVRPDGAPLDQPEELPEARGGHALPLQPPEEPALPPQHRQVPERRARGEHLRLPRGPPPLPPEEPEHGPEELPRLHEGDEEGDPAELRLHRVQLGALRAWLRD